MTPLNKETNYLFFVYMRKDNPGTCTDNFSDFIQYVYTVKPAERDRAVERIEIRK